MYRQRESMCPHTSNSGDTGEFFRAIFFETFPGKKPAGTTFFSGKSSPGKNPGKNQPARPNRKKIKNVIACNARWNLTNINRSDKNPWPMKTKKPHTAKAVPEITLRPFREPDIDFVIARQLALYAAEYGFTSDIWKTYLTGGVNDFVRKFDSGRDCMYIAEHNNVPCGCIAITHADDGAAQLRFYFMEKELRGNGAGHRLIDRAIGFSRDAKYERVFLWTFSTLDAARHLYAGSGFRIRETQVNNEWGEPVLEERWELEL